MRTAVVVSGSVVGLGVIRSLGMAGVPVVLLSYSPRDVGRASTFVRETVPVPHPEKDEQGFLAALGRVGDRHPRSLLVPASDESLAVVPHHEALLRGFGYVVACTDAATTRVFLDKAETAALARSASVPAPVTVVPSGRSDVEAFTRTASFPAVLKPLISHSYFARFQRKWVRVDDARQAREEYERAADAGLDVLLQEYIPGDEAAGANYNAYFWDGEPCVELTAEKVRNWPADTGSPCATVSRHIPEIVELGRRLLGTAGFSGFANIEFKRDARDGEYKLIEVNARHNLSSMLSTRCGVNFAWLQYRHLLYGERPTPRGHLDGVHWVDVTRDLRSAEHYLRRSDYSLRRFLTPYVSHPVFAVWSPRDPWPALVRGLDTARAAATRLGALRRRTARNPAG